MQGGIFLFGTLLLAITGCGGGGQGGGASGVQQPISVDVNPKAANLPLNGTQQYSANVANTSNSAVTWAVVEGAAGGSISQAGLYTAPLNSAGTFHIQGISQADISKTSSVPVVVHLSISASPPSPAVTLGQNQQFSATVVGVADSSVTWSIPEGAGGGAITAGGLYTAPRNASGVFHVVATSHSDPTQSATSTVTVQAGSSGFTIQ